MKLKILIGILVFLIAVNLATIGSYIYFQTRDHNELRRMHVPEDFREGFSPPHLGLDHKQRQQLFELRKSFENETREYTENIRELREDIFSAIREDTVSLSVIEGKLDEISDLRKQIEKVAIKKLLEAKNHLSPLQRDHLYRFLLAEPPHFNERAPFQRKPGSKRGMGELDKHNTNKNKE